MNPQSIWTPFIATPRDEILDRVRTGALTPEQAEIEAKAGGFGPLESKPDAACYDPMRQVWWSLPMVAAWVGWRNFNAVRRAWPEYSSQILVWDGPITIRTPKRETASQTGELASASDDLSSSDFWIEHTGHRLEHVRDLHVFQVLMRSALNLPEMGKPVLVGKELRGEIWRKLESGLLICEGLSQDKIRRPIRNAEWIDLDEYYDDAWPSDAIGVHGEKNARYFSVRAQSKQVLELWPSDKIEEAYSNATLHQESSSLHEAIRKAHAELWPSSLPGGMRIKERDSGIMAWFKERKVGAPSSRTISRALKAKS